MVRINLLPVRVSKKREAGKQQLLLFLVVLVLGLVVNVLWANSRADEVKTREARVARTRAEIQQLDRIIGEVKNIKDAQKALRDKLAVLDRLKQGRTGPVRMLDELASITPKRLWVRSLDQAGDALRFEGTAGTIDDVSAFMTALQSSRYFTSVELKKTTAKQEKGTKLVDFTLAAAIKREAPPAAVPATASSGKR